MTESSKKTEQTTQWHVYIVRCADDTLYTGVSTNVADRVKTHNLGQGAKYTRARLPVHLVYSELADNRSCAQQREYAIKKLSARSKNALIDAAS